MIDSSYLRSMQKPNIQIVFKNFISLLILWISIISVVVLTDKNQSTQIEVPRKYEQLIIFNTKDLFLKSLKELVLNKEYQFVYEKIKQEIKSSIDTKETRKTGIDFLNPILYVEDNGCRYFSFQLTNKVDFYSFAKSLNLKVEVADNKGFLILAGRFVKPQTYSQVTLEANKHICYFSKKGMLNITLENNKISINGKFSIPHELALKHRPKQEGLVVQLPIDFLKLNAMKLDTELQQLMAGIDNIAVAYRGGNIGKEGFVPLINAVFQVNSNFKLETLKNTIMKLPNTKWVDHSENKYHFQFQGQSFSLLKIAQNEWFLGIDSTKITQNNNPAILQIQGDLSALTSVQSSFLVGAGLNLIPAYTQTKALLNKVEKTNIQLAPQGNKYELKGSVEFKTNQNAVLELLGYALLMR
jgi:hypothetical protein